MTATENPFRRPSEAPAPQDGLKLADFEGALSAFTYRKHQDQKTSYGVKRIVVADIECIEGVKDGTVSNMPSKAFPPTPKVLKDITGQVAKDAFIFAGYVIGAFNGMEPGQMLLGRIVIEGREYEGQQQATWILKDPSEADMAKAVAYLNAKQAGQFSKPAESAAASSEPNF